MSHYRFPDEIFVTRHGEPTDEGTFLSADTDVEGLDEDDADDGVAVYRLVSVGKVLTTRRFVVPPDGAR